MTADTDTELDLFRAQLNCAAVLENLGRPWKLDPRESTRRALKCVVSPSPIAASGTVQRGPRTS